MDLAETLKKAGIEGSLAPFFETDEEAAFELEVPGGEKAVETWRKLNAIVGQTGHWPVIIGTSEDLDAIGDKVEREAAKTPTSKLLAEMEALPPDPTTLTEKRISGRYKREREYPSGRWPAQAHASAEFSVPFDEETGKALPTVHVALLPTPRSWQVPLILRFGGEDDCPPPLEHAALMRHWQRRYSAEIVSMTYEVCELLIGKPPKDKESALQLAIQQYDYCKPIVDQGLGTVEALAGALLNGSVWHFFWE